MTSPTLNIPELVLNYRGLVHCFVGQLLLTPAAGVIGTARATPKPAWLLSPTINLAYIAVTVALVFYSYRTARSLHLSQPVLWALAMFVPGANLITLLALSAKSTAICREHGIAVGLLGPRLS